MEKILTIYFSGTGNTKYIAKMFSARMNIRCLSIEDEAIFSDEIQAHDIIAVCYPNHTSRVPYIMREFVAKHMDAFEGKKIIIFITQVLFSGDGARVLCDLFPKGHIDVIYAEHFIMPINAGNIPLLSKTILRKTSDKFNKKRRIIANAKMKLICRNIENGLIKKRGFSVVSRILGMIQGVPWQGSSKNVFALRYTVQYRAKKMVWINSDCNACNLCVKHCPAKNLVNDNDIITHKNNCTTCFRCVNICPKRAITVMFRMKPAWQYKGHCETAYAE